MAGDDEDGDDEGELDGAAMEGAGELDVARAEGHGHLGLEGTVDHLDHLEGDAGDGAGGGEDDDGGGSEGVADGEDAFPAG